MDFFVLGRCPEQVDRHRGLGRGFGFGSGVFLDGNTTTACEGSFGTFPFNQVLKLTEGALMGHFFEDR